MPTLKEVLGRAPDGALEELLPAHIRKVVKVLEREQSLPTEDQVELLIELRSPAQILRNSDLRSDLFTWMRPDDVQALAGRLGFEEKGDPYEFLLSKAFYRGSDAERTLFDFFGEQIPTQETAEEKPSLSRLEPRYGLFDHQRNVLRRSWRHLESDRNRVFLHMPTGSGKTRIAMKIIARTLKEEPPSVVLWLASGQELLDQAAEEVQEAWEHLGDRDIELSRFYGDHSWNAINDGVVVAGLSKIWEKEKRSAAFLPNLADDVSLVVFDEAHQSVAGTYEKIVERVVEVNPECGLVGLSATPGRSWADREKDRKLSRLFYKNKEPLRTGDSDPLDFLVQRGYLSEPEFHRLPIEKGPLTDREIDRIQEAESFPAGILKRLAEDDVRNVLIAKKVQDLIDDGHTRILVFATTVDHAKTLEAVLRSQEINAATITSETPDYIREQRIREFKQPGDGEPQVLTNYGVLTTGFDAPNVSAAVIARPTKSLVLYSQMVGRAIRGPKVGGTESAEIWTVVDTDLPGFGSLTEAFWNWEDVW
jgi:superfamily II DNA or RNA helicase